MLIAFLTPALPPWFPLILFGAVAAGLFGAGVLLKRRRTEALTRVAQSLGFTFDGREWENINSAPQLETPLFARQNKDFLNIMSGNREGLQCSFFDYLCGAGRDRRLQTVAAFTQAGWMPAFQVGPQDLFHKLGNAIVHKEIHFDADPDFTRRFRLTGADPDKARELFSPSMLSFFNSWPPAARWHLEGFGKTLVIFRPGKKISAGDFPTFVDETSRLAAGFFSVAALKKSAS